MSNGIGSPKEDIKKYDIDFLKPKQSPSINMNIAEESKIDSASLFGTGYTEEEKIAEKNYIEELNRKAPVDYDMGLAEKGARSFVAGIGDLIQGMGDAVDFISGTPNQDYLSGASELSKDIYGLDTTKTVSSFFSDAFHTAGKELQSVGDPVAELGDVENITWSDMFDVDFWFTHASRAIPFTLSFFVPGMAGAKAGQLAYKGLSLLNKGKSVGRAMQKLNLVKHMHQGSKFAQGATSFAGGAALGNMSEGAIIAGQVYNDALKEGMTEKQASVAAHDTFVDNMKWMAVDGLQLGFLTGGNKFLKTMLPKGAQKSLSLNFTKAPGIKSMISNMAKVSGIVLTDGMLEQFQETYQDWASKTNLAEQRGEEFMSYMDFFSSKENLPTRVIAFASSMAVSGAKTAIDVSAERKRLFSLEKGFQEDFLFQDVEQFDLTEKELGKTKDGDVRATSGKSVQELKALKLRQLDKLLVKKTLEGKGDYYIDLVNHLLEDNKITKAQHESFVNTAKEMETLVESTPTIGLNEKEKAKIILATRQKNKNNAVIQNQLESLNQEKEKIKAQGLEADVEAKMLAGVEEAIAEVQAGDITLLDEENNPLLDENGNEKTARKENTVHEQTIKSVYAESTARRESERADRDVRPKVKQIIEKENQGQELTEEEQSFKDDKSNKPYYEEMVRSDKLQKAQDIAGSDFTIDAESDIENENYVFKKVEGDKVTTKSIDASGTVTETVVTDKTISEDTTKEAEEETKESADNRSEENETDKNVTGKEDSVSDTTSVTGAEDQKQIKASSKANKSAAQERLGKKLYGGQLEVWADEQMAENPNTAIFFDESLIDDFGRPAIGMALGLAKFINPLTMTQEVFHHENWHTYQTMYQNSNEMQALLNEIVNQPIFEETKLNNYTELDVQIKGRKLKFHDLIGSKKSGVISINEWMLENGIEGDKPTIENTRAYLFDMETVMGSQGYFMLPDSQQNDIKNESLAIAGGLQSTMSSPYWTTESKKPNSKVRTLLTNAWARIKKGSKDEIADKLLSSHFPEYYNSDYATMLNSFQNAVKQNENPISWSTYTRSKGMFLKDKIDRTKHENISADMSIDLAVVQSNIIQQEAEKLADSFYNDEISIEDLIKKTSNVLESKKQDIIFEIKKLAKLNNTKNSEAIERRFQKRAKRIDSLIKQEIFSIVNNEIAIPGVDFKDLKSGDTNVSFGNLLNESFKRGTNKKVTEFLTGFTALYNKNKNKEDAVITKAKVETVIAEFLDGNRNNYENFELAVNLAISNVSNSTQSTSNEKIIKEFVSFVNSKLKSPGVDLNTAINNIWQYFKAFRHEQVFQFNIDENNNVIVSEALPKQTNIQVSGATQRFRETLINEHAEVFRLVYALEAMRDPVRKKDAILSLFNKIIPASSLLQDNNLNFVAEDIDSMKIAGMPVMEYFTNERIDFLQSEFISIDWGSYLKKQSEYYISKDGIYEKDSLLIKKDINALLKSTSVGRLHQAKAIQARNLKSQGKEVSPELQRSYDKYLSAVNILKKSYEAYAENPEAIKEYKTNFYVPKFFNDGIPKRGFAGSKLTSRFIGQIEENFIKEVLQAAILNKNTRTLIGQVRNPENESIGTFNKTSYLYNNVESLESVFKKMKLDKEGAYPSRLMKLFGINPYAYMMFESVYNQTELNANKMKNRAGIWNPEIGYMSGYYDGRNKKGYKNSRMNAKSIKHIRFMHIVDSIKNKAKQYKHFVGVFGDSQRQYFINNAMLFDSKTLDAMVQDVKIKSRDKVDMDKQIDILFNELIEVKLVKQKDRKAVEQAYKQNYVNKFYIQDLYFNKSAAMQDSKMMADLPKRMKGITSPLAPTSGTRILPIIIKDDELQTELQKLQIADSESFILPEHQKLLALQYGELNEVGNNLKSLYYGQNLDNIAFENHIGRVRVPLYFKTATKVLEEEFSQKSEVFRALREVLNETARRNKGEAVIPIIYFDSSIKGGMTSNELGSITHSMQDIMNASNDIYFLNKQKGESIDNTYQQLIDEGKVSGLKKFIDNQNKWYQFESEPGVTQTGFDGSNFGIQTKLDNNNDTGILAKQLLANLNVFNTIKSASSGVNKGKSGYEMLQPIKKLLSEIIELQYAKFFADANFEQKFEQRQEKLKSFVDSELIKELGISFAGNEQIFNDVVSSMFKAQVMRLETSGTFSVEMSDIGYNLKINEEGVSYSETLKSYKLNNGSVTYGEVVMPFIAKQKGYKVGDKVLVSRIPHSKPGDGIVMTIKEFNSSKAGNTVIIPTEHASLIGSDKDGDGLHINMKTIGDKLSAIDEKKNEFLDSMFNLYTSPEVYNIIMQPVDFTSTIRDEGLNHIQKTLSPEKALEFARVKSDLHINDEFNIQDRFLGNFIGIAASMNRTVNYFASSGIEGDLATEIRVKSAGRSAPLNLKIQDKSGKINTINKLTNRSDKKDHWLTYAQYLNFIIDDGKAGDRAKFNITQDSASHFSYLLRAGMSVKGVLDLMYHPTYVSYITNRADGLSKRKAIAKTFNKKESQLPRVDLKKIATINLGSSIDAESFTQLVGSLDLITSDIQVISEMLNLDQNMPNNMIEAVSLSNRFDEVMARQNSLSRRFNSDPYLKVHRTLLDRYKDKLNETSTVSAQEAEVLIGAIRSTVDLNNETASELINNAINFYKLSTELKPNFEGKSFHNLYLDLLNKEFNEYTEVPYSNLEKMLDDFASDNQSLNESEFAILRVHELASQMILDIKNEGTNKFINALQSNFTKLTRQEGKRSIAHQINRYFIPYDVIDNILTKEDLKTYRDSFMELPKELRNFFIGYEYFVNKLGIGTSSSLMAFLPKQVTNEVKRASKKVKANTQIETAPGVFDRQSTVIEELIKVASNTGQTLNENGERINKNLISEQVVTADSPQMLSLNTNLVELMIGFDPVAFGNILNDSPIYMYNQHKLHLQDETITSKFNRADVKSLVGAKGKMRFTNEIYKSQYKETSQGLQSTIVTNEDGSPVVVSEFNVLADRDWSELNTLNMYAESLDADVTVVKSKANGSMFLRDNTPSGLMFGAETNLNEEAFARNQGFIKSNMSLDSLSVTKPSEYERFKSEYAYYRDGYTLVEGKNGLKQKFLNDTRIQMPETPFSEIPNEYYIEARKALEEYQSKLVSLHPLAKQKISETLLYKYGEIVAQTQNQRWRNVVAPDGERVGEYLLNQVNQTNYDKDISYAAMVLSPGDFGQHNPTLAGVRRNLEVANSKMHRDLKQVQDELNNAYNALYKEKYGLLKTPSKIVSNLPVFRFFHPLEKVAENLFANLQVQKTTLQKNEKTGVRKAVYQTELSRLIFNADNTLRADAKSKLSKAEYNYAQIISRYTRFYNDLLKIEKGDNFIERQFYRPLTTASRFEVLRRRGIYGLYKKSLSKDNLYHNIYIKAYDPFSQKMETKTYAEFKALYSVTREEALQYAKDNPITSIVNGRPVNTPLVIDEKFFTQKNRVLALKKAKDISQGHMLKMRDELGNPIKSQDEVSSVVSAENETFNRYTSRRSESAAYFASNNLHHAMFEYLKTMVFQYGTAYKGDKNRVYRINFELASEDLYGKKAKISKYDSNGLSASAFERLEKQGKGRNFMGFERQKFMVDAAKSYLYHNGKQNNSIKYLNDVVMDRFIKREPKKLITGSETERKIADTLTRWTMVVGLGLNVTASVANVAIGKYNAYRSQGFQGFVKAHARVFGIDKFGKWDRRAATKAQKMLEEFGILTYRPQDQLEDSGFNTIMDNIIFSPMITAEKFIQRAQFMGELSDEQWNAYDLDSDGNLIVVDKDNVLSAQTIAQFARRVQNVQGRGYSEVDQRLIQTYALGSMVLQFKRWFPTFLVDRFGKGGYESYIDDFGNAYRGTTPAVIKNIGIYANPFTYNKNKAKLDKGTRDAIERYHRGMWVPIFIGLLLLAGSEDEPEGEVLSEVKDAIESKAAKKIIEAAKAIGLDLEKYVGDMLLVGNVPQYEYTLSVASFSTALNILGAAYSYSMLLAGSSSAVYSRDAKYGKKGESKGKRYIASLTPKLQIPGTDISARESIFGRAKTRGERSDRSSRRSDRNSRG